MCAEMMDVTRDEAKRILRRLELEAYSSIISAFRAQGDLSRSKKKILQELGTQLSISTERHRAEVRRAYSDDRLAVVAESVYGPGSCAEWAAEGKRLVPLMPRLVPQTVFSASATAAANTAAAANAKVLASSGSKASSSSTGVSSTAVSPSTVSSNGPTLGIQQSATKASNLKTLSQTGETQVNDTDSVDDHGKPKRRRRLSVSSLNKPVTKVTIPTPLVTKPLSKTTSVSTMTKAGKSLGPVGTVKAIPRISPLSASASQVKLLTKTVAVTQTVCQAKTLLSYKTLTSSPVKVQTVTTQSTPKTQTKVTPAMPPKVILASKTPSATTLKSVSTASTSSVVTTSPIPVTLKTTTLTAAQLAGRQRVKQATTRFKPLPGTVKFKTVTPATMGTCSTVTMVTPSPSSQASSALPVSGTQPVVRVIHVPGSGGVGVSKPVVVMTTGLGKSTIGGVLPGATTGATSKATSQVTHSSSAAKTTVSPASTLPSHMTTVQTSKTSSTVAQPIVTTPKTVVMTTLVGTKRVVLSVPAPLQVSTISSPTISSQGIGIVTSVGGGNVTPTTSSQLQSSAKKDILPSPLTTLCVTGSVGQLAPSHSTSTVTTQVRSRPLPALLPAPPKPYAITCSQTTTTSTPTTSGRKLPTLLPAPAKSMAVIPTVLVPVDTGVGSTTTGQVQPSVPVAGTPVVPEVDGPEVCLDGDAEHCCGVDIFAGQDCSQTSADPASLPTDQHVITTPQCLNKDVAWNKEGGHQFIVESPNLTNRNNIKSVPQYELSNVTDGDNNTSSEDDSLLMCSETIDNGCNLADTNARALDYLYSIGESTPIKPLVTDVEHVIKEVQPSLLASSDDHVSGTQSIAAEPRIDIEESDSRLQSLAIEKELTNDQENSLLSVGSLSKVTVERLDDTGGICDVVQSNLSHHLGTNSVDLVEQGKVCDAELHVDPAIHSVELNPIHEEEDQNFAKDERHTLPYQMENALKVITSFVESMEGGPLDKEENKTTNPLPQDLNSELQTTRSFPSENEDLPQVVLDVGCERNSDPSQDATASSSDHIQESSSNMLLKFPEDNWDAIGDASIDILSTSTSSCSSTPECSDVTDKDIKSLEAAAYVRTSGRKRKPPTSLEVSPSRQGSGWVRGALSLLQRVASYRGQGRRKGDFGAATWFLKPVDPVDAPGYYKVIKTPMDFGTIKIKLESGNYQQYSEFHSDMLLVKSNCLKYNPPGHDVRQDCDEVFKFYESEYTKMLERWEKCHVSPAKKPRVAAKAESAP